MDLMKDQAVLPVIGTSSVRKDLYLIYAETIVDDLRMVHLLKPPRQTEVTIEADGIK